VLAAPYSHAVEKMERRFLTTSVVPAVIFLTAYGAVAIASLWSFSAASSWAVERAAVEQLLLGVIAGALTWFLAGMMSSNWRKIVRLYEGYPATRWLRRGTRRSTIDLSLVPGVAFHRRQKDRLAERDSNSFYIRYPLYHDDDTLPTTVGNIMLAGERYGVDRYGFEMNVLWTRFAWCLPNDVQKSLDQFKEEHQLPLALSFTAACFAVASGVTVVASSGSPLLFAASTAIGMGLSAAAYLLAIERTEEYSEQLRATVDLHHHRLREAWVSTIPDSDLAQWFGDARAFIEGGQDALNATRVGRSASRRAEGPMPDQVASGADSESLAPDGTVAAGPPTTARPASRRPLAKTIGTTWRWFWGRVRLLWAAMAVTAVLIGLGCQHLAAATESVVVVSGAALTGQQVQVRIEERNREDVPAGAITDPAATRLAIVELADGTVVTAFNTYQASDISLLDIKAASSLPPPGTSRLNVILMPCGLVLENVLVTAGASPDASHVQLGLTSDQLQRLDGCAPDSVSLLPSGDG
jgi:hypothetical protein